MSKQKFRRGSVGAYLLHLGDDGDWRTLVHRRSHKVASFRDTLATPGGAVDKKDPKNHYYVDLEIRFFELEGNEKSFLN